MTVSLEKKKTSQNFISHSNNTYTFLDIQEWLVPMCPLFGGSTIHKEEDNLSIVDKMAGLPTCPLFRCYTVHIKEYDNLTIVDKMAGLPMCPLFRGSTVLLVIIN